MIPRSIAQAIGDVAGAFGAVVREDRQVPRELLAPWVNVDSLFFKQVINTIETVFSSWIAHTSDIKPSFAQDSMVGLGCAALALIACSVRDNLHTFAVFL
jgi:hypothetical protein